MSIHHRESLQKTYQPKEIEQSWAEYWEKNKLFQPVGIGNLSYCIMLPPPNVTGTLHMGHGFQQTLMDALIRFHRMEGNNTLWQGGTDHAGIATQMVVERQLAKQNLSRQKLGRTEFLKKMWEWRHQSGQIITQQIRRLGASIDWSRERFSMDDNISHATIEAFVRLHQEGLIYRGKRLVNWDTQLKTAISDLEVNNALEKGNLWYLKYPLVNSNECLIVATTRPETMLGDTAVAVHPDDERYQHLIGKNVKLPLVNRLIPIISDESIDPTFGTGCVKITPAHDFNDYIIGKQHNLSMINIMTTDGCLNSEVPKTYQGLDRFVARKKIVSDFKALGLLEKIESHEHNVPRGDRSDTILEPLLMDQWFLKMDEMAKKAIEAFEKNQLEFVPATWGNTYLQWLNNIQDWCISRQLWWGHRIPVWYDETGNYYVGYHETDVRTRYHLDKSIVLRQDEDVLDTWFSAALWPFASLGWPQNTPDFKTFYPTQVLITGFDIIFFWVARMVMLGIKLTGKVPFNQVYITGLIRDSHGQKMSKSKGNVLDPIDLIDGISLDELIKKRVVGLMQPQMEKSIIKQTEKDFPNGIEAHGTDALRFTFCALANTGRNINFDMNRLAGYRNFCNKIWNAARYVLINTKSYDVMIEPRTLSVADQWIISQLQQTIVQIRSAFLQYRFDQIANLLFEFTWNQYCDWYLELSKCDLIHGDFSEENKRGTRHTLLFALEQLMRLMHPLMPYITETIWQEITSQLGIDGESIMLKPYPISITNQINATADSYIQWIKEVVTAIRNIRGEMHISPAKNISIILAHGTEKDRSRVQQAEHYLKALAKINRISWHSETEQLPASATAIVDQLDIHIPLAELIDQSAELKRLTKEIEKLQQTQTQIKQRLSNHSFVEKAPEAVIQQAKTQLIACEETLKKLLAQQDRVRQL